MQLLGGIIMEALNISEKQFSKLLTHKLPSEVLSSECNLYILKKELTDMKKATIFKRFLIDEGEYFGNKLLTINYLIDSAKEINMDELVLPEKLVIVNDRVVGYLMRYIKNNINLTSLLKDNKYSIETKKQYLKQIGEIIDKLNNLKLYNQGFYLGDLHDGNFIVDKGSKKLYAIDMDSCKVGHNMASHSRYLLTNINYKTLPLKYPRDDKHNYIPNLNTEYACYITTVLNFIADGPTQKLSINQYYNYLNYLNMIGFSNDLLESFGSIYTNFNNTSPLNYIDQIPNSLENAKYENYLIKTKKRLA